MSLRHLTTAGAVAALVALSGCGGADGDASPSSAAASAAVPARVKVEIASFRFLPRTIVVRAGGRVTWTNRDKAPHTATADDTGMFDTATIRTGQSRAISFSRPGTYSYYCLFHPFMVGEVVVR
jgi:plastocyanin